MDDIDLPEEEISPTEKKSIPKEAIRIMEAVLFASDDVLTPARLKTILPDEPDARVIRKMVDDLNIQLQHERHPFEIVELAGGYQFRTIPYYQPWVQQLFKEKVSKKISVQGLECLAIIAYKQPLSKADIEAIRGVLSDGAIKTLLERHLITITGRSEKAGRPLLYGTTPEFLKYFGINKLADLPNIEEFEALAKEKMEELSDDELSSVGLGPENISQETNTADTGDIVDNQETVAGSVDEPPPNPLSETVDGNKTGADNDPDVPLETV